MKKKMSLAAPGASAAGCAATAPRQHPAAANARTNQNDAVRDLRPSASAVHLLPLLVIQRPPPNSMGEHSSPRRPLARSSLIDIGGFGWREGAHTEGAVQGESGWQSNPPKPEPGGAPCSSRVQTPGARLAERSANGAPRTPADRRTSRSHSRPAPPSGDGQPRHALAVRGRCRPHRSCYCSPARG